MIAVYLMVGFLAATGASIYSYAVLDASVWLALAVYVSVGSVSVIAAAVFVLFMRSREQSRPVVPASASYEDGAIEPSGWEAPVDAGSTSGARAA